MGGGIVFTPAKPDPAREVALGMAVQANPGATSEQIVRDAERFLAFLKSEPSEA